MSLRYNVSIHGENFTRSKFCSNCTKKGYGLGSMRLEDWSTALKAFTEVIQ